MTAWRKLPNAMILGLAATVLACGMVAGPVGAAAEPSLEAMAGKRLFIRCIAWVSANGPMRTGSHLEGIVGRKVASVPGFKYTGLLRAQEFSWDEVRLNTWLESPQADFAGMCLPFKGFSRPEDRAALIAYLKNPGA